MDSILQNFKSNNKKFNSIQFNSIKYIFIAFKFEKNRIYEYILKFIPLFLQRPHLIDYKNRNNTFSFYMKIVTLV